MEPLKIIGVERLDALQSFMRDHHARERDDAGGERANINWQKFAKATEPLRFTCGQPNGRRGEGVIDHVGQPGGDRLVNECVPFDDEVAIGGDAAIAEPIDE